MSLSQPHGAHDRHTSFADFARTRREGADYTITTQKTDSPVAVLSIHGGIEGGMTPLARAVAGNDFNLFSFHSHEGAAHYHDVHITSNRYDEPRCVDIARQSSVTVSLHGCRGDQPAAYIGGRDAALAKKISDEFNRAGIPTFTSGHAYPADAPENICNRNQRGEGVQIEFTQAMRRQKDFQATCANALRACLTSLPPAR